MTGRLLERSLELRVLASAVRAADQARGSVALVSGDRPDMLSLLGFGTIGLLLGASVGLIHAEGL